MKTILIRKAYILCLTAFVTLSANAQYTETFESQTPFLSTFNSNGQSFSLTNSLTVYSSRSGFGYENSNRFVDNSNMIATNQVNSIKTTDATKFAVKGLWLYVSTDGGNNPSINGSVIITGKLGGVVQFTINKTSGFSTSFVPDNGFSYVDFTTESGVDNSNIMIDEIDFQLQGNFNYIGIDNFTWAPLFVLPLSLVSYSASIEQGDRVKLSWQTAYENNTSQFIIKRSSDGKNFKEAGTIMASGNRNNTTNYQFTDMTPMPGANYYSLEEVDKDGVVTRLGVKEVTLYNKFNSAGLYPNPVTNGSFTLTTLLPVNTIGNYFITDISGRIVQKGNIISARQKVDVSRLAPGNYTIKLSDGEVIKWIKK
jgi:hypothetical protein